MFQGANYNPKLEEKDIAKLVKQQLKQEFPNAKWSIRTSENMLYVSLMEYDKQVSSVDYLDINIKYIEKNINLSPEGKILFIRARDIAQSYNYNASEAMIDYFDFNFVLDLTLGRIDKPFKITRKG